MVPDRLFDVLPRTVAAGTDGRLTVGGCALADVAEAFGTQGAQLRLRRRRSQADAFIVFRIVEPHPRPHAPSRERVPTQPPGA